MWMFIDKICNQRLFLRQRRHVFFGSFEIYTIGYQIPRGLQPVL